MAEKKTYHSGGSDCAENENVLGPVNIILPKPLSPGRLQNISQFLKRWLPNPVQREGGSSNDEDRSSLTEDTPGKKSGPPLPASLPWLWGGVTLPQQPQQCSDDNRPFYNDPVGIKPVPKEEGVTSIANKTAGDSGRCDKVGESADGAYEDRNSPPICRPGNVDWDEYKSFLLRVWEENSLDASSLNAESSTLPSLSSLSEDLPFAIDLLTSERMFTHNKDVTTRSVPNAKVELSVLPSERHSSSLPFASLEERGPIYPTPPPDNGTKTSKSESELNTKPNFVMEPVKPPLILIERSFCPSPAFGEKSATNTYLASTGKAQESNTTTTISVRLPPNPSLKTDGQNTVPGRPQESTTTNESERRWAGSPQGNGHTPPCPAHKDEIAAIKKELEDAQMMIQLLSAQDLSTSTLVMDPMTYKQVADKYIAARKKPVRRTHTCHPSITSSDLVCDSTRLQPTQNPNQSSSCPSSPLGSKQGRKNSASGSDQLSSHVSLKEDTLGSSLQEKVSSEESDHSDSTPSLTWSVEATGGSPMNSKDYHDLLQSLDGLGISSSSHP